MAKSIFDTLRQAGNTAREAEPTVVERLFGANAEGVCEPKPDDLFQANPEWQPKNATRRVEVMVTGHLGRVGVVRDTVSDLQDQLFGKVIGSGQLELRVTAFLDGCRHSTPWSNSPIDVGSSTTRWHCFQDRTRYAEALEHSSNEDPIDAIIMYGNRFDDDLQQALRLADRLRERGTRIYAFHVGNDEGSRNAYEQLAERTGGISLQLTDERAFAQVMPIITDYLFRKEEALLALPAPKDPNVKALVDRLKTPPARNDKV
ncbi:MAG TPA: hypothetical protein VMV79_05895 [Alphaproteobacteria bacterium]|nr:hypothetical protein [Alphaproteobacteria bacterium]